MTARNNYMILFSFIRLALNPWLRDHAEYIMSLPICYEAKGFLGLLVDSNRPDFSSGTLAATTVRLWPNNSIPAISVTALF